VRVKVFCSVSQSGSRSGRVATHQPNARRLLSMPAFGDAYSDDEMTHYEFLRPLAVTSR
jgi:hypothetical protein